MLSKPKMPTPYNSVVDANGNITCSCVLTEGNVGRCEVTISDLYGNEVSKGEISAGSAYFRPNSRIETTLSNDNIINDGSYKWKARLFEPEGVVSTWCTYGSLQNHPEKQTPIIPPEDSEENTDNTTVTLQISAHQNIEIVTKVEKEEEDENAIDESVNATDKYFLIHNINYLADGINYHPDPYVYRLSEYDSFKYLVFDDKNEKIFEISNNEETEEKPTLIQNKFKKDAPYGIGIIEDVIPNPNGSGLLVTIYDFNGQKYQAKCYKSAFTSQNDIYDSNGQKKPFSDRVRKYTLTTTSTPNKIKNIEQLRGTENRGCLGEYDSNTRTFSYGTTLDENCRIISIRDYKKKKLESDKIYNTKYTLKIGGVVYDVVKYKLYIPDEDLGIATAGQITIKRQDGAIIDLNTLENMFKQGMQYTIYQNFIDSDEYYFKTFSNLKIKIAMDKPEFKTDGITLIDSEIILDSEVLNTTDGIQNSFYGYLCDYNDNMYQSKIISYKWTVSVRTLTGKEVVYSSGMQYGNSPTLLYKDFIEDQEYIINLEVTTDNNMVYTSDDYVIQIDSIQTDNIPDLQISAQINNEKHAIAISWHKDLYKNCVEVADKLSLDDLIVEFDRIDIYKTMNGTMYNKVASIPADLTNLINSDSVTATNNIEDFMVGNGNSYEYILYPVFKYIKITTDEDEIVSYHHIGEAKTSIFDIPLSGITVLGLLPQVNEDGTLIENSYCVDYENIWRFALNVKNDVSTFNMAHTLHEGQERFNKMSVGRRGYITSGVSALLGDISCSSGNTYLDGMDTIDNWEQFINNGEMKIICDQYGRILPVDINECSYSYDEKTVERVCTISFNYTQLADINDIEVLANNEYIEMSNSVLIGNNFGRAFVSIDEDGIKGLSAIKV